MNTRILALLVAGLTMLARVAAAAAVIVTVQTDQPGAKISPWMYGIFFEDINYGADGGLYADLVKNRSFEFTDPLMGWRKVQSGGAVVSLAVRAEESAFVANPHYLRLQVDNAGGAAGVVNEGFRGMGVRAGETCRFSAHVRSVAGNDLAVVVELVTQDGRVIATGQFASGGAAWHKVAAALPVTATDPKARLQIRLAAAGTIDLDHVSLFPEKTWKGQAKMLRADVVQMLADLKPGFMRFPGGCIVEGRHLPLRYQWKTTIGPVEERKLIINRWNDEFKHRPAPDYFQSFGLGFYEYFLLCEDIGAAPLPILNCGMACQFNSGELAPLSELEPYIQDALDLIEFANGPATSVWGAKRVAMGHPAPFHLKLLGVGNEQWGPQYLERYAAFAKVLKAKHPEILLVSSAGPGPNDDKFHFAWPKLRELKADIVDEHCYARPDWFFDNTTRYDPYDRNGPKVFMGEYAAQSVKTVSPDNRNNWECALSEAAYLIGLERNADVVTLSSYAPLFGHVEGWQWTPNLIWFDNLRVYGTPSYHVQKLFSLNRGDVMLPVTVSGAPLAANQQPRVYACASLNPQGREIILKFVNATAEPVKTELQLKGSAVMLAGNVTVLAASSLNDENSLDQPNRIAPVTTPLDFGRALQPTLNPYSLTILRLRPSLR